MNTTPTGLVAILRGLTPGEAPKIGETLHAAGFRSLEIPLNSPRPFESIERLRSLLPPDCSVGAGTVLTPEDVERAKDAGSDIIVSPNTNVDVINRSVALEMRSYPGVATPTEAFTAIDAGATSLKLFPADAVGIPGMKAWRAVLPSHIELLPVGGVDESNLAAWIAGGAGGAGIGGTLYKPGHSPAEVGTRARKLMSVWQRTAN